MNKKERREDSAVYWRRSKRFADFFAVGVRRNGHILGLIDRICHGGMLGRRDVPPVLLLLLLIILILLTLSQILVVHHGRFRATVRGRGRGRTELRRLDINLQQLLHQNVPSVDTHRKLLQNERNEARIRNILQRASDGTAQTSNRTTSNRRCPLIPPNLRKFRSIFFSLIFTED